MIDLTTFTKSAEFSGPFPENAPLKDFYQEFVAEVEKLHNRDIHEHFDVSGLVNAFQEVGVTGLLKDEISSKLPTEQFALLIRDLGLHLGMRLGTVVVLNHVEDVYQVYSATLIRNSIQNEEYLGHPLTSAQVKMKTPRQVNFTGFSVNNVALHDPERAKLDSASAVFNALPALCAMEKGELFAHRLHRRIENSGIKPQEYLDACAVPRAQMLQRAHARNHVFSGALLGHEALPAERTLTHLKDASELRQKADAMPAGLPRLRFLAAVNEYSASLAGIMMELDSHITQGNPTKALLAFDDFLWDKELRLQAGGSSPYGGESACFFSRLKHLLGNRNVTPANLGALLQNKSMRTEATNARNLLRSLHALDFLNDEERAELVGNARPPT